MSEQEIKGNIKNALIEKQGCFEDEINVIINSKIQLNYAGSIGQRILQVDVPTAVSIDALDGLKLKYEKGFISIRETYKETAMRGEFEKIGYIYRFITNELEYNFLNSQANKQQAIFYRFHYDMPLGANANHPKYHLQVLHDFPRFESMQMEFLTFLNLVENICFDPANHNPILEPIYARK
jgi:hypothetical protein